MNDILGFITDNFVFFQRLLGIIIISMVIVHHFDFSFWENIFFSFGAGILNGQVKDEG